MVHGVQHKWSDWIDSSRSDPAIFLLVGHIKPAVRAIKRKSRNPGDKEQWAAYKSCLEDFGWHYQLAMRTMGLDPIPKQVPFVIDATAHLHRRYLWQSDVDNQKKTIFDAGSGVVWEDDRYCVDSHLDYQIIPDDEPESTLVRVWTVKVEELFLKAQTYRSLYLYYAQHYGLDQFLT